MFHSNLKVLSSKAAAALDQELMSFGAFSLDQLMELAGLSVAQVIHKQFPPPPSHQKPKVLFLIGPGNNGGDGLVAARHLKLWGEYDPVLYYPKKSTKIPIYQNLLKQLRDLEVEEIESVEEAKIVATLSDSETGAALIVDALFGFSFKPPIRPPYDELLTYIASNHSIIAPIVSVDIPSGWDVDQGPISTNIDPAVLISLTAPKPCAKLFDGKDKIHYLGGRFINNRIAKKYDIEDLISLYKTNDLIVKL